MNATTPGPLLVPIEVSAMVLQTYAVDFIRAQMNYANLASCQSPSPGPFHQDNPAFAGQPGNNHGVYLQWTLPAALRHAAQDQCGALQFPFVPNRWLVVRIYRPDGSEGSAVAPQAAAWVIESDSVDPSGGARYIDPNRSALTPINIGCKRPTSTTSPWQEPGGPATYFLQAVAESNPAFAAYQPFNTNVFSIHDELRTQGLAAGTLSYFVLGWYSDASADPLAAWPAGDFTALLAALEWTATAADGASQSLYHGAAFEVPWAPEATSPPPSPKDHANPRIAIGNTSVDAIIALMEAAYGAPNVAPPADLSPCEAADLLEAFYYNLLPVLDQPGAEDVLQQAIHDRWFASRAAGTSWTIVDAPVPPGAAQPPAPSADELAREAAWLAHLNTVQAQFDGATRELMGVQRRLFEIWWKAQDAEAIAQMGSYPWRVTADQFTAALTPEDPNGLIGRARALLGGLTGLTAQIPHATAEQSFDQAILAYATDRLLPATRALQAIAEPRFWEATDPVLVLSGTAHTRTIDPDRTLACRWPAEIVTSLDVRADGAPFPITVTALDRFLPMIALSGLPTVAPALFAEFFLLDPANARLVAAAAGLSLTSDEFAALTASIAAPAPTRGSGTLPAISPPFPWAQPWQPLYLDWQLSWYPIPFLANDGTPNWAFDGIEYDLARPVATPTPQLLQGRSVLTPTASSEFKARLDQFIREYPESPATAQLQEVENFVTAVDHWDFLSQTLDGLNTQLMSWNPVATLVPPTTPLPGGPESLADLVGDQAASPPDPRLAEPERKLPPSTFEAMRGGQFSIARLALVDAFGQTLELVTHQTAPQTEVIVGVGLEVCHPVVDVNAQGLVQLPPRLLQAARLNLDFVLDTTGSPILGWVLPDHLGRGLGVYGAEGTLQGELSPVIDANGDPFVNWWPAPDSPYLTLAQLAAVEPQFGGFLVGLQAAGAVALADFLRAVDETLWTVDPLGGRADPYVSVLLGRPLAVVAASISLELQTAAITDPAWPYTFAVPTPLPLFLEDRFPVQLGRVAARQDGLLGYFSDGDYSTFNAVYVPAAGDEGPPASGYLAAIGPGNWLDLGFAASGVGPARALTLLMDPRASVHAQCGILPVKDVSLPSVWVDDALTAMKPTFRVGPLLAERRKITPGPGAEPVDTLLLPSLAGRGRAWLWRELQLDGTWPGMPLGTSDGDAALPDTPPLLRHGVLQASGDLDE